MSAPPKRRRFTLTQRVVWAVTATVALFVGLQSLLAYFALHTQEDELTDDMLRREVQQLITLTLRPGLMPVGALHASSGLTAYLTRGSEGAAALPAELKSLAPGLYQLTPDNRIWHVAVVDTEDGRLCIVLDATDSEARVFHFGYTLLALWAICVAAAALIARGVASIAVGPMVDATRSIGRWAPDRAAGQHPPLDEAGVLMETFNRFRDRVDETVAREREFAANLDHEIRTPLTTIRTDAELIALESTLAPTAQQRIDRIIASVDDIVATTESTLSSSAGRAEKTAPIALRECLRTVCDALADRAAQRDLRIDIAVADGPSLVADRQALLTVCRNLVRNAIEHAAPATLRIEGDARGLSFSDDGPGIAAAALAHVFERFHQGRRADVDDGANDGDTQAATRRGLGLAIAQRMCDLQGWRLSVRSPLANDRGTTFVLDFETPE
ncbi:MAG: HAMP domain-containing histidine kinase [Pseudomonadota bacterium]|nr:HAMP domain-containing histidine kinase [Pseudomonadota bacterium]